MLKAKDTLPGLGQELEQSSTLGTLSRFAKWLQTPKHDLYLKALPRTVPSTTVSDISCVLMVVRFRIHDV